MSCMPLPFKKLLNEDPDYIEYNGNGYSWENRDDVVGLFSVIDSDFYGRPFVVAASPKKLKIFLDDDDAAEDYEESNAGNLNWHKENFTHHFLLEPLRDAGIIATDERVDSQVMVSGRIWEDMDNKGYYMCSFWENHFNVRRYETQIHNAFVLLGANIKNTVFEFIGIPNRFFSYDEVFNRKNTTTQSKLSDEQINKLRKLQHFSPEAKRAVLTKYPPNRLQVAADKLGISYAQLRHILSGPPPDKKSFEEVMDLDAFLDDDNLSFSDYFHPDIPYEVKPIPSIKPME